MADWFEEEDDVPFMMKVFQIQEQRPLPAVCHADGSGRLQTVHKTQMISIIVLYQLLQFNWSAYIAKYFI